MPVPQRRTSKRKTRQRRSHDAITAPQWITCSKCGEATLRHRVCPSCGHYKSRAYIVTEEA